MLEELNPEQIWLEEARKGNKVSFGKLIEAYQRPVYNLAYRMLNNSGEAEEAAQEAFIRAYTRLHSYNPDHKFSSWILSITSNYCIDQIRKRKMLQLSIDEPIAPHPALMSEKEAGPEGQAVIGEQQQMVQKLLATLPEDYREAVILRYWHELSYDEIAKISDSSVSAIKSRLFRGRKLLVEAGLELGLGTTTVSREAAVVGK